MFDGSSQEIKFYLSDSSDLAQLEQNEIRWANSFIRLTKNEIIFAKQAGFACRKET